MSIRRKAHQMSRAWPNRLWAVVLTTLLALSGCMVGPNYRRPPAPVPTAFKEKPPDGWKEAQPNDAALKGKWWEIYNDPAAQHARRTCEHFESERIAGGGAVSRRAGRGSDCAFRSVSYRHGRPHGIGGSRHWRSFGQPTGGDRRRPHQLSNPVRRLVIKWTCGAAFGEIFAPTP